MTDRRDQRTQREARVKRSDQRTHHSRRRARPHDLMALYAANAPDEKLRRGLRAAVGDIVRQQASSASMSSTTAVWQGDAERDGFRRVVVLGLSSPRRLRLRESMPRRVAPLGPSAAGRKEFAEFYAAEASPASSAARQSGSSSRDFMVLPAPAPPNTSGTQLSSAASTI